MAKAKSEATEVPSVKGEATVVFKNGTRTYTEAIHGKEYRALAEEFAGKKGGKVV